MVDGYDPASFDIVREEFQRDDRDIDRLREEERRLSEERDIDRDRLEDRPDRRPEPFIVMGGQRVPNPEFIRQYPDAARDTFGFTIPSALAEVINDDNIMVTEEMLEMINDPEIMVDTRGRPGRRISGRELISRSGQFSRQAILPNLPTKKKRKVSPYQKEFGKQLKKLKKKHPRTKITRLMKRAHAATRKVRK